MNASRNVSGGFFQTRVFTPRMTFSSISKGEPGAVSRAWASASDMAGHGFPPGDGGRSVINTL